MSLSCIVQTLWDIRQLQSYNLGNSIFICQQKHLLKIKNDVGLLIG